MRLTILAIALFALISAFAAEEAELQEVRLAKAQIALAQNKDKEALSLVAENLNPEHFHRASYQFLIDYHLSRGHTSRAVKVLYYMIGKLHDRRVLSARYDQNFLSFLKELGTPSRDALEVYFAIAELYYSLYERNIFDQAYSARLLVLAEKYFQICNYYRYESPLAKVYLGKIESNREKYEAALGHFVEAKELFQEQKQNQAVGDLDFLIGKTLIHGGLLDPGSVYLRSIYLDPNANQALKNVAQEYLNILSASFFSISLRYSIGIKTNIYELREQQLDRYNLVESILGPKDGSFNRMSANAIYNWANITENTSALFIASFSQDQFSDELHQNRNSRSITAGGDLKLSQFEKGTWKLRYLYTNELLPTNNDGAYESFSTTHFFEPSYVRPIKSGTLTYSLPLLMTNFEDGRDEKSTGFAINYAPFSLSSKFQPYISLAYYLRQEIDTDGNANRLEAALGMQSDWSKNISTFSNLTYRKNSHDLASFNYNELELSGNLTWNWRWGISFTADLLWYKRSYDNDQSVSFTSLLSGIAYTF